VEFKDRPPAEGVVRTGSNKNMMQTDKPGGPNIMKDSRETWEEYYQRVPEYAPSELRAARDADRAAGIDPHASFRKMAEELNKGGVIPRGYPVAPPPPRATTAPSFEESWAEIVEYSRSPEGIAAAQKAQDAKDKMASWQALSPEELEMGARPKAKAEPKPEVKAEKPAAPPKPKKSISKWREEFEALSPREQETWLREYHAKFPDRAPKKPKKKGWFARRKEKANKQAVLDEAKVEDWTPKKEADYQKKKEALSHEEKQAERRRQNAPSPSNAVARERARQEAGAVTPEYQDRHGREFYNIPDGELGEDVRVPEEDYREWRERQKEQAAKAAPSTQPKKKSKDDDDIPF
jgi:hypothetical protein